jgi:hypothetical protein
VLLTGLAAAAPLAIALALFVLAVLVWGGR